MTGNMKVVLANLIFQIVCILSIVKMAKERRKQKEEPGIYENTMARMRKLGICNEHDAIVCLSQEIDMYREKIKHIEQERRKQE